MKFIKDTVRKHAAFRQRPASAKLRVESLEERALLSVSELASALVPSQPSVLSFVSQEEDARSAIPIDLGALSDAAPTGALVVTVTTPSDVVDANDGVTSLREALATSGVTDISFSPSLQGQTISLSGALTVATNVRLDASALWDVEQDAPGLTIDAKSLGRAMSIADSEVELLGLRFVNAHSSGNGGAIYLTNSTLTVDRSVFESNDAAYGGAVYGYNSTITLDNSRVSGNRATSYGGGIWLQGTCALTLTNTVVTDNSARMGGGIVCNGATLTARNATIANNSSSMYGGAVYLQQNAVFYAYNTIFALNSAGAGNNDDVYSNASTFTAHSCLAFGYISDNLDADAIIIAHSDESIFLDAEDGDYRLSPHSKAVDAGDAQYAVSQNGTRLTSDLRGLNRVAGGAVDIGAYEYHPDADPYVEPKLADSYVDFIVSEPWYDADKRNVNIDGNQCWAASASNMLWSTRWGQLNGMQDEEELMQTWFAANFPNDGGQHAYAFQWALNNEALTDQVKTVQGGFYSDKFSQYNEKSDNYIDWIDAYSVSDYIDMATRLRSGSAVGIAIYNANQSTGALSNGHALTVYGYAYNPALDPTDPNYYTRLYFVDSNDQLFEDSRERNLLSFDITWTEGLKIGSETKSAYVISNYSVSSSKDPLIVASLTFLTQRPSKYALETETSPNLYFAEKIDDSPFSFTASSEGSVDSTTFIEGEEVTLNFSVNSTMNLPNSKQVKCKVLVDDEEIATVNVGQITQGATQTYATSLGRLSSGTHFVTVVVDSENTVAESNENDNAFSVAISIQKNAPLVVTTATDVVDANDGVLSLREALALAGVNGNSSRVTFDESLQGETITLSSGALNFSKNVTIDASALWDAEHARPGITVSGNNSSKIFNITGGNGTKLIGLELTKGSGGESGGAIVLTNAAVTIDRCWFTDNHANYGGALCFDYSDITILNSVFRNNSATVQGGAIFFMMNNSPAYIANTLFDGNSSTGSNAGGGAISIRAGEATFTNTTFVKNTTQMGGGAVLVMGDTNLNFYNTIFALNSASMGDDLYNYESKATVICRNTIASSKIWTSGENNQTTASIALFTDANAGDYTLARNSAAIDFGDNVYAVDAQGNELPYDIVGKERIQGVRVDAGAYESGADNPIIPPDNPTEWVVTTSNDVVDPQDGLLSLREAIDGAAPYDIIVFDSSLSVETGNCTIMLSEGALTLDRSITIDGGNVVTLQANGESRIFTVTPNTNDVTLKGLTITNGYDQKGGAMFIDYNSSVSLKNVDFANNTSYRSGGAIYVEHNSQLSIDGSIFSYNDVIGPNRVGNGTFSNYGGAISAEQNSSLTIRDSEFKGNSVTGEFISGGQNGWNYGGAISAKYSQVSILRTSFQENRTYNSGAGGAIYSQGATFNIQQSLFLGNIASSNCGAISTRSLSEDAVYSHTIISDALFAENRAGNLNSVASFTGTGQTTELRNVTIANNTASTGVVTFSGGTGRVYNSIIADSAGKIRLFNADVKVYNTLSSETWDASQDGGGNLVYNSAEPLFVTGGYTLAPGSKAIDAGNSSYVTSEQDLAGNERIQDGSVDLGAYEYTVVIPSAPQATATTTSNSITVSWSSDSNVSGYRLIFDNKTYDVGSDVNSYTFNNLSPSTTYSVSIAGIAANGELGEATTLNATTKEAQLPAPMLRATTVTATTARVSWTAVEGAAGYKLTFGDATITLGANETAYEFTGLTSLTDYSFSVAAVSATGLVGASSTGSFTTAEAQLAAPVLLATSVTTTTATVGWNAVEGAAGYKLTFGDATITLGANETTYEFTDLASSSDYSFSVAAVSSTGLVGEIATGAFTTEEAQLSAPVLLATSVTTTSANVGWNAIEGAAGYKLTFGNETITLGSNETTYEFTDLASLTDYSFTVAAVSATGLVGESATGAFTTAEAQLSAPVLLATSVTTTTASVGWNAVEGATGYKLNFGGATIDLSANETTYEFTGLASLTDYSFSVAAVSATGLVGESATGAFTTAEAQLVAPELLSTSVTTTSANVGWNAVEGATGYKLIFGDATIDLGANETTYEFTGLASLTDYSFSAAAVSATGLVGASSSGSFTTAEAQLSAPVLLATSVTTTTATIGWNAVEGAAGYKLTFGNETITLGANETTYEFTDLASSSDYSFTVAAVSATGLVGASSSGSFTTAEAQLAAPELLATSVTTTTATVDWNVVEGATGYKLTFGDAIITLGANETTYEFTDLASLTDYSFSVAAVSATGLVGEIATGAFTTEEAQLAAPELLATSVTTTTAVVGWNAVEGAVGYKLTFSGETIDLGANETSYEFTDLAWTTDYTFSVAAVSETGLVGLSSFGAFTTLEALLPSPELTSSVTASTITVSWDAIEDAVGYELTLGANATITLDSTATSYTFTDLWYSTNYVVKARALGKEDGYHDSEVVSKTIATAERRKLDPPTIVESSATENSITINWDDQENVVSYTISYRAEGASRYTTKTVTDASSYVMENLSVGTAYHVMIRANGDNKETTSSTFSPAVTLSTHAHVEPLAAPTVTYESTTDTITVSWYALDGATGYAVAFGAETYTLASDATSYEFTDLAPNTSYTIAVAGLDARGAAGPSTTITATTATEVDYSVVTTTSDVVDASDGVVSLREALAYARPGETVTFDASLAGQTITLTSELLIENSVSLDGGALGITLSGGGNSRVIRFLGAASDAYTLSNLTITEGSHTHGAGVYVATGTANIVNCTIVGNNSTTSGGGLYVAGKGSANVVNTLIAENSAKYGGGVYSYGAAGNAVVLTNCTITNNSATNSGAGLHSETAYGTIEVRNSIIAGNTGKPDVQKKTTSRVVKAFNTLSTYTAWSGGSRNNLDYDATRALFVGGGDYSLAQGSQAVNKGAASYVTLATDLAGNSRIIGAAVDLGAYEQQTTFETPSTTVTTTSDVVDDSDGAISLREALAYAQPGERVTFDASLAGQTITLDSELLVENSVSLDGGALGITLSGGGSSRVIRFLGDDSDAYTLSNLTITEGAHTHGSGVYVATGTANIVNCALVGNNSTTSGGGLYVAGKGSANVVNTLIANNSAKYGGGVYCYGAAGNSVVLTNCTITNNSATNSGAGLHSETAYGTIEIRNSIIAGNTGKPDVQKKTSSRVVKAFNTLSTYTAWSSGSSANISYVASEPLFTDAPGGDYSLAEDSQAVNKGNSSYVTVATDLVGNPRVIGAAVDLGAYERQSTHETPSTRVTTTTDVVDDSDGAISLREALAYAQPGERVTFDASLAGQTITLTSELLIESSVSLDGGALGITLSGGGSSRVIRFLGAASDAYTLSNLTITEGAHTHGAGVYVATGTANIVNCTIVGNNSTTSGGGLYVAGKGSANVINTLVANNSAKYGGGVYSYGAAGNAVVLTNCTIAHNSATNSGSGLHSETAYGTIEVRNSIIAGNTGKPDVQKKTSSRVVKAFNTLSTYTAWSSGSNANVAYNASQPLFTNAAAGDFTLAEGSQALDLGDNSFVDFEYDLDGDPRIVGALVDLGAFERQASAANAVLDLAFAEFGDDDWATEELF